LGDWRSPEGSSVERIEAGLQWGRIAEFDNAPC